VISPTWQSEDGSVKLWHGNSFDVLPTFRPCGTPTIICDPPYGISFQSKMRASGKAFPMIVGDEAPCVEWILDGARALACDGAMLCFCRWDVEREFADAMRAAGLMVKSEVIWDKGRGGLGDLSGAFAPQHENILFATKSGFEFPHGRPPSVLSVARVNADEQVHPNEKPVGLMEYLVRHLARRGQVVLDPFMGSGATGVACVRAGRSFWGIELDDNYFEIAQRRIEQAMQQTRMTL
jgi:DNA modification methylase